jgi:DNA mismatch endonuclease (patch repair protein)
MGMAWNRPKKEKDMRGRASSSPKAVFQTDERTSRRMSAIRPLDTRPERTLRRLLTRMGFRYRLNRYDLPGRPDFVLSGRRCVIFLHGCFWHRHRGCFRATMPGRNVDAWQKKFENTVVRDRRNIRALQREGWRVLVVWECQLQNGALLQQRLRDFLNES